MKKIGNKDYLDKELCQEISKCLDPIFNNNPNVVYSFFMLFI